MNYFEHWDVARSAWLKHYEECANELDLDPCVYLGDERRWAIESWEESEQIKILHNGTIKIKWEHTCWWADCKHSVFHGEYYAILAGLDQITWEEPYDRAMRLQEESE